MLRFLSGRPRTVRVPIDKSNVEVQQVKVYHRSRPVVGRFLLTCAFTYVAIQAMRRWDPLGTYAQRDVLQDELEKVKKSTPNEHADKYGKHWDKQHAQIKSPSVSLPAPETANPDAIRITVPIWLRRGSRRLYNELDPEWKEFVRLQTDPKRVDQLRRQVGETVMLQVKANGNQRFELALIKFNGKVGVALEMVPQIFTPPIYEVPCFWLSPSSLRFGWRPLPPHTGARVERIFRPVVLYDASSAAIQVFFSITYAITKARVMEKLGLSKSGDPQSTIALPQLPPATADASVDSSVAGSKSAKPIFPGFPSLENGDTMRKMHSNVVSAMPFSVAIQHATYAFNHVRNARQKMAISRNVKGICQIRGHVTFFGDRGKLRLDIIAYYLPAENAFLGAVNVKSGYVVQDYAAWDRLKDDEKKQKEQKSIKAGTVSPGLDSSKPPDVPPSDESEGSKE